MLGNCLVCAVWKFVYLWCTGTPCLITSRWCDGDVTPHFYVVSKSFVWDFELEEDIWRRPFYYLLYRGSFRKTRRAAFERSRNWGNRG